MILAHHIDNVAKDIKERKAAAKQLAKQQLKHGKPRIRQQSKLQVF